LLDKSLQHQPRNGTKSSPRASIVAGFRPRMRLNQTKAEQCANITVPLTYIIVSATSAPSSVGTEPVILFLAKFRSFMFSRFPISVGSVPANLLDAILLSQCPQNSRKNARSQKVGLGPAPRQHGYCLIGPLSTVALAELYMVDCHLYYEKTDTSGKQLRLARHTVWRGERTFQ
jgi:hypothetical protein